MKEKPRKTDTLNANGKRIIYAPVPPAKHLPFGKKKKPGMPALQAIGGKPSAQRCPLCGHKTELGKLACHPCYKLTAKVRVRKRSTLSRKKSLVKVKSHFQQKLSDESGGWY
jgi:hypothetical protein